MEKTIQDGLKVKGKVRENSLDIVRGIAVLLMIMAHTIYFFHDQSVQLLSTLQNIGDTLAFTVFLLVSGATIFYSYQRNISKWSEAKSKMFRRILIFVIGYYVTAIISFWGHFDFSTPYWFIQLIRIITFMNPPGFTEFMITFVVYYSIFIIIPDFFNFLGKKPLHSIIASIILFGLGTYLYGLDVAEPILSYKMLLAGNLDSYRFPILQYFPVFIFGLNLGNLIYLSKNGYEKKKILFKLSIPLIFFALFSLALTYLGTEISFLTNFDRWPPSLLFISAGLLFSLLSFFLIINNANRDNPPFIYHILISFGKNSFLLFVIHIVLLQIYDKIFKFKSDSIIFYIIATSIVLALSNIFVKKFNNLFSKKPKVIEAREDLSPKSKSNVKLSIILTFLLSSLIFTGLNLDSTIVFAAGYPKRKGEVKGVVFSKKDAEINWWNYDYQFSRRLTVINDSLFSEINQNDVVEFVLNYENLINDNKLLPDLRDVTLVYLNNGQFDNVEFKVNSQKDNKATIRFKSKNKIDAGQRDNNYFMYYGNSVAANLASSSNFSETKLGRVSVSGEKISSLSINLDRNWILIGETTSDNIEINLQINQNPFPQNQNTEYSYQILGTDVSGTLFKTPEKIYTANINIDRLKPGNYQIQAKATALGKEVFSTKESFIISYPLYIVWSMDWEGYDVQDRFLNAMDAISRKYSIPISHFFNPRIYLSSAMSSDKSAKLTDWVKQREREENHSVDLHVHMFHDMVRAAGVDPEKTDNNEPRPQWGSVQQFGYDTLLTSYNYDELKRVLDWGKTKFAENGLSLPKGFRAGGWFADLENLKSIQDSGFLFDSSGREQFEWGSRKITGPWELRPETQPFRPSTTNQNSPSPAPNLNIWEFPNNGADSYSFSDNEMLNRFNANFGSGILQEKRVVTYLSHPHWFNIDEPKLYTLFDYINNYSYRNDAGPVVYKNIHEIYDIWTK